MSIEKFRNLPPLSSRQASYQLGCNKEVENQFEAADWKTELHTFNHRPLNAVARFPDQVSLGTWLSNKVVEETQCTSIDQTVSWIILVLPQIKCLPIDKYHVWRWGTWLEGQWMVGDIRFQKICVLYGLKNHIVKTSGLWNMEIIMMKRRIGIRVGTRHRLIFDVAFSWGGTLSKGRGSHFIKGCPGGQGWLFCHSPFSSRSSQMDVAPWIGSDGIGVRFWAPFNAKKHHIHCRLWVNDISGGKSKAHKANKLHYWYRFFVVVKLWLFWPSYAFFGQHFALLVASFCGKIWVLPIIC